jgi:tetratricopeptide (TPR) repeat protein
VIDCTDNLDKEAKELRTKGYTIITEPESLIVLPFKNVSGDKELDWLSMGLWDILSIKLGYVQGFKTLRIRDYITEARRIPGELALYGLDEALGLARAMSAKQVWTGEINKDAEGNIEVDMEGFNVKSGRQVFSKKLKSPLEKLPLMMNGMFEDILAELGAKLGGGALSKASSKYVSVIKAWEYNARGYEKLLLALLSGDREKRNGFLEESIGLHRTSVEEDPRYASGWCNLGWALLAKGDIPAAKEGFKKSLKIKRFFIEANMGMGYALWEEAKVGEAVLYMKNVMKQNPALDWTREDMKKTMQRLKHSGNIRKREYHMNMDGIRVVDP